jgi:S1-C subfamily serine protease
VPPATASSPSGSGALDQFQDQLRQVVAKVLPSVVEVDTPSGLGSGIVFDSSGHIVTNAHVVEGESSFSVITNDGRRLPASVAGIYSQGDLAVLKVSGANLPPAQFADSSKVKVGDVVLAVGSPYGLSGTVTDGIVSAVARTQSEGNGVTLSDLIQTSAGINPGNSGGALVNLAGQVVGIPTLSGSDQRQRGQVSENIGFAISSNQATNEARQLIASGAVTHTGRAYLGVSVQLASSGGAQVQNVVAGGPADKAGIGVGSVITAIDDHRIGDPSALTSTLSLYRPGDKVSVTIQLPDGGQKTVTVTLGERPATS